jgi:Tfp pilus assembly protein PilX
MTIKKSSILKSESGAALVIALIMMIVLTLIGLASIFSSTFEMKLAGRKKGSTNAFYAADSGIDILKVNIQNFSPNNPNPYPAFTDPVNIDINPTLAAQVDADITYNAAQIGAPRGSGISATYFEFEYFVIASTGRDQTNVDPVPSRCTLEEKVVRVVPNLQGGN